MFFTKDEQFAQQLTLEQVQRYSTVFGISDLTDFAVFPEGYENTSVLLVTQKGRKHVLRISSISLQHPMAEKVEPLLIREIEFMKSLRNAGIPVPRLHKSSQGAEYHSLREKNRTFYLLLMDYVEGKHPDYKEQMLVETAALQARMHEVAKKRFASRKPGDAASYSAFSRRLQDTVLFTTDSFPVAQYEPMKEIYDTVAPRLRKYYMGRERFLIHNDLKANNLLWSEQGVAGVIDFGDARHSVEAEDLGAFIWDLCDKLYLQKQPFLPAVETYLFAYQKQNDRFMRQDLEAAVDYAIDRYLCINLHYLIKNQVEEEMLKYQVTKATHQLHIIRALMDYKKEL